MLCYVMLYVMFYVVHQMIDWLDSQLIYKVQDSRLKDPNSQFGGEASSTSIMHKRNSLKRKKYLPSSNDKFTRAILLEMFTYKN
jgi:hypothetical protein